MAASGENPMAIDTHISTGPCVCNRCLWRLANIRAPSRGASVQTVTAASGPAID